MAESSNGVMTVTARKKLCEAHAGDQKLSKITTIAWGNGGVDEKGIPKQTTGNEISLYGELLKKDIETHVYVNADHTSCRYTATLEAGELTGEEISEMGLFDEDGDMVAYRTFLRKGKDEDIPQIYDMDEIF